MPIGETTRVDGCNCNWQQESEALQDIRRRLNGNWFQRKSAEADLARIASFGALPGEEDIYEIIDQFAR